MDFPDARDRDEYWFKPGQFNMLYMFGVGEIPISVSSAPHCFPLAHTIRWTGRVTDAFKTLRPGDEVGVRGPFGRPWPVAEAHDRDLLIVAGGLGLAPVRSVVYRALARRERFDRVMLLVGARGPEHMLFRDELDTWVEWLAGSMLETHLTVDVPDDSWPYAEGVVTELFDLINIRPESTIAFACGPEIMMQAVELSLSDRGVPETNQYYSFERNMHCAEGLCGHCQLGPKFVCADGPVFSYEEIADLWKVDEL
jgi:NAD(P)H-flavin reductase